MEKFLTKVDKFNQMYELPRPLFPVAPTNEDISNFRVMICEEISEVEYIFPMENSYDRLTAYADLLGDLIVYCHTEARRRGIPMEPILDIIMESNFSKLAEDGSVIKDSTGKVGKGPFYWGPGTKIKNLIKEQLKPLGG